MRDHILRETSMQPGKGTLKEATNHESMRPLGLAAWRLGERARISMRRAADAKPHPTKTSDPTVGASTTTDIMAPYSYYCYCIIYLKHT